MFEAHIALSTGFVSLIAGMAFLVWLKKQNEENDFAKWAGYLVVFFSITGLLCTTYYATNYWQNGYFKSPHMMNHDQVSMEKMNCPMMQTHSEPQNHEGHRP